jgi:YbbR domain-containing protein
MMRFIREALFTNWMLKIAALVLALIFWLIVRGDPGVERVLTIPLEVRIPAGMEITNERPTSVDVTLRGNFSGIWFAQGVPICSLNMEGVDEGEHIVPLGADNVQIPRASSLEVLRVNPARITLMVEKVVLKEVPIDAPVRGKPFPGHEVYGKTLSRASAVISGPRSRVEKISKVSTEPISVEGQKQPVLALVNLNIPDNMVRVTASAPIEVTVAIGVIRRPITLQQVPVLVDDNAYHAIPGRISVQLLVPITFNEKLSSSDLSATVSVKEIDTAKLPMKVKPNVRLKTNPDPAIEIKEIWPSEVTLARNRN